VAATIRRAAPRRPVCEPDRPFKEQFLEAIVFHDRDANLSRSCIDQDFFLHTGTRRMSAL